MVVWYSFETSFQRTGIPYSVANGQYWKVFWIFRNHENFINIWRKNNIQHMLAFSVIQTIYPEEYMVNSISGVVPESHQITPDTTVT